jgi:6-pyruvoyltetrahydropterin/6-carboxytetrahydropterin synthase
MFEVEIISGFAAAHRLREYNGKCEHLHGHNYRVHVTARAPSTRSGGMVIDFITLKQVTKDAVDHLDHGYLNEIEPFDRLEPSAENLARYLFEEITAKLGDQGELVYSVSVWESDTSRAGYVRDVEP